MSERFKEHAWNACVGQLTESSNLSLPAIFQSIIFKNTTNGPAKASLKFKSEKFVGDKNFLLQKLEEV